MNLKKLVKDKKGEGIVTNIIAGIAGLIILVIVMGVILDNIVTTDVLSSTTSDSGTANNYTSYNHTYFMLINYTVGLNNVSTKIPTILLIAAVVLLFGAIVILVQRSRMMTADGGSI